MDRVFLDANVLFSAAYRADAGVARIWSLERVELLTSEYAIEEARRNLDRPDQRERLVKLLRTVVRVPTSIPPAEVRGDIDLPAKDWPILGAASAASASHLVTGDRRDFGPYFGSTLLGVHVIPPSDFLLRHV